MKNFVDRVPTNPNKKKITFEGVPVIGINYATVEFEDTPTVAGTNLNRQAFMAMQGFISCTVEFDTPTAGDITETNGDGDTLVTEFPDGSTVVETFTSGAVVIIKTTTFNIDGSITIVIS